MIKTEDAEFHEPDSADPTWAETNYFGFYSAEANLNCGVYTLFRPNLGVVHSTICLNSGDALLPWHADYCDLRSHLPIPEPRSLLNYSLANGLTVRTLEPNMAWHLTYDDGEGTSIDVTYRALMPPFDIHDPEMDPMVAAQAQDGEFAWGTAYNGHFDQTGHFTGEVVIRGRRVSIDCVSTMDHSWGPRAERGAPNMSWLHAHFSDRYAVHAIFSFDQSKGGEELILTHGYVLEDGEIYGLRAGVGRTQRDDHRFARRVELEVTDKRGNVHHLRGTGLTRFPWQCWPNMVGFNVLARWECGTRVGYGEIQDFFEVPGLTALNAGHPAAAAFSG